MNRFQCFRVLFICCLTIGHCTVLSANNNLFLPGDAFFPTVLSVKKLTRLKANAKRPPVFEYSSYGGYDGALCGYAGYGRAKIPGLDKAFVSHLKSACVAVQKEDDLWREERKRNGDNLQYELKDVRVLFYAASFKYPDFEIGLRYNENWVEETVKFGHRREHVRLCCLVNDKDAVMTSWRDSKRVAALKVTLPNINLTPEYVKAAVTIKGPVKALLINARPLTEYFHPKQNSVSVWIVDSSGVTKFAYTDMRWKVIE